MQSLNNVLTQGMNRKKKHEVGNAVSVFFFFFFFLLIIYLSLYARPVSFLFFNCACCEVLNSKFLTLFDTEFYINFKCVICGCISCLSELWCGEANYLIL